MRALQRLNNINDMWSFGDEFGRLVSSLSPIPVEENPVSSAFNPVIDVVENKDSLSISVELPGLKKADVKVKFHEGVLTLSGEKRSEYEDKEEHYYRVERRYGAFSRSFSLPKTVDAGAIEASMKDGVLVLRMPKKPEAKEREIEVSVH